MRNQQSGNTYRSSTTASGVIRALAMYRQNRLILAPAMLRELRGLAYAATKATDFFGAGAEPRARLRHIRSRRPWCAWPGHHRIFHFVLEMALRVPESIVGPYNLSRSTTDEGEVDEIKMQTRTYSRTHSTIYKEIFMKLNSKIRAFLQEEDGVTLIEYALLAALITVVSLTTITSIGTKVLETFKKIDLALKP